MILKQDWPLGTMRPVMGQRTVRHGADQGHVVVHDDAVVEHRCVKGEQKAQENKGRQRAPLMSPGCQKLGGAFRSPLETDRVS